MIENINLIKVLSEGDCSLYGTALREPSGKCICKSAFIGNTCHQCQQGFKGDECSSCEVGYYLYNGTCYGNYNISSQLMYINVYVKW